MKKAILAVLAFTALSFIACDTGGDDSKKGSVPAELVGEWAAKSDPSVMVFKITSDGTFTSTGQSGGDFDKISVSGKTVEIKYSGTPVASFDYSISNGEMTITNATGFMAAVQLVSPFVKVGSSNPNSGGLSALVGVWQKNGTTVFEVTSAGKFIDIVNDITYDISVSGNTATLKFGGTTVGTFNYAINDGQMVITSGTGIGMTYAALSPLGKSGGDNPVLPGGGSDATVTFSLDKVNSRTFTVTVDGAKWQNNIIHVSSGLLADSNFSVVSTFGSTINATHWSNIFHTNDVTKTSDTVFTYTLGDTWQTATGTISFKTTIDDGASLTDGGSSAHYVVNTSKSSVSFP